MAIGNQQLTIGNQQIWFNFPMICEQSISERAGFQAEKENDVGSLFFHKKEV